MDIHFSKICKGHKDIETWGAVEEQRQYSGKKSLLFKKMVLCKDIHVQKD